MNANELKVLEDALQVIETLQAEIQALKQIIDANNLSQNIGQFVKPAKTLTDEEIKYEAKYFCHSYYLENPERLVLFARTILRKAQEK
jgi:hypothetical protein